MFVAFCLATVLATVSAEDAELLQFTSAYCPACRTLEPVVDRLAEDGVRVRHLDFEANEDLARKYNITRLPTLVLVRQGQEVDRMVGAASYDKLAQWLQAAGGMPNRAPSQIAAPSTPNYGQPAAAQASPGGDLFADIKRMSSRGNAPNSFASNSSAMSSSSPNALPSLSPSPQATHQLTNFTSQAPVNNLTPDQLALAATVRLKVDEGQGFGYGTGTIVDCHGEEALVLTCAHLFRESQGKGKIVIDMFAPGQPQGMEGQLIDHDLHRDVALVSFRPGIQIAPVPVAGTGFKPQIGQPVFSIGCDKGNLPSVIGSQVATVDKYHGRPNVTVKGQPVVGRSGGGLFSAEGHLIGVCNAADAVDNEGLYASLPAIHWQLDRIGQQRIYQESRSATLVAAYEAGPTHLAATGPIPSLPSEMPGAPQPQAAAPVATVSSSDLEMFCVIRSKSQPHLPPQTFPLQQLPTEVQQQIIAAQQGTNVPHVATNPGAMIIRGQR